MAIFWAGFYHFYETAIYRQAHGDNTYGAIQLWVVCGFLPVFATISSILAVRQGRKEDEIPDASDPPPIVEHPIEVESLSNGTSTVFQ